MRDKAREFTPETKREIWRKQWGRCAICGEVCKGHNATRRGEIHHIKPISLGGGNEISNGIGLCDKPCHQEANDYVFRHTRRSA